MGKQNLSDYEKEVKLKGIETSGEGIQPRKRENIPTSINYEPAKTKKEAFLKDLGSRTGTPGKSQVRGSDQMVAPHISELYEAVNLAKGIPDFNEREKYLNDYGNKLIKLVDEDSYGVRFEKDLSDIAKFREHNYHSAIKNFIDDLDENQGWFSEVTNTAGKFIGKTSLAVGSLVPMVYGLGSALFNWDKSKAFDNSWFDAWEYIDQGMDKHLAIYGGSDQWEVENGKLKLDEAGNPIQKAFLSRFISDPMKSLNADIVPAASFVSGAIITEIVAGALAPYTGGASVAFNTARLAAQGTNTVSKGMRVLRGLDKLSDIRQAVKLAHLTRDYHSITSTLMGGLRSSAYESALIARSTQDRTLDKFLVDYHVNNGGEVDEQGNPIGELVEPTSGELARFKRLAADAGELAFTINVPLVAGSNFIQMPKLFLRNWKMSSLSARGLKNYKLQGTRIVDGKRVANVDANAYLKYLGYGVASAKGGITEGWEEFAQGAMEEGLIDYYSTNYGSDAAAEKVSFMNAMVKAGNAYYNTTEGKDSITIGALMGMLGMRVPIKMDKKTGKYKFSITGTAFGGIGGEVRNVRDKIRKSRADVEILNSDNTEESLKANFHNFIKHTGIQKGLDDAAVQGDVNQYKNKEHDTLFSAIYNRASLGLGDTILQDIDGLKEMPLAQFNEQYGTQEEQFTEETKREAVDKAEKNVIKTLKAIEEVNGLVQNKKVFVDKAGRAIRNLFKKDSIKNVPENVILGGMVEQLSYLHSTVENSQKRVDELEKQLHDDVSGGFSMTVLDKTIAKIADINDTSGRAELKNNATELYKTILQEWKENNSVEYNLKVDKVKPILQDIIKLKLRAAEASIMYKAMFTPKGAEVFAKFTDKIAKLHDDEVREKLKETIKKDGKEARNPSIIKTDKNENSLFGNTEITNEEVNKSTVKGLKEYSNVQKELENEEYKELENATLQILDKNPGFFALVKARLLESGTDLSEIKSTDQLRNQSTDTFDLVTPVMEQIELLVQELEEIQKASPGKTSLPDFTSRSQPPVEGTQEPSGKEESPETSTDAIFSRTKVSDLHITLATHDKQFNVDNELVRGPDGKFIEHIAKKRDDYYVIDNNKINSADFLPNSMLLDEGNYQYAIFKVPDSPFNATASVSDMAIDVYHQNPQTGEETFIGQLPASKEGTSGQLLQLRQAIIEQDATGISLKKVTDKSEETKKLVEEKQQIKQDLKKVVEAEKEISELEEEKTRLIPEVVEPVEGEEAPEVEEVDTGEIDTKIEELNKEVKDIDSEKLKSRLTEVNKELAELSKGLDINIDLSGDNVFATVAEIENIPERNKNRKVSAIKEAAQKFGKENIERAVVINENFDSIIEQITNSGINVFFDPDEGNHKECD